MNKLFGLFLLALASPHKLDTSVRWWSDARWRNDARKWLFGLLLALAFLAPGSADAATCFWVGGTGSINDTTKWSISSGGAGSTCLAAGGWPNSTADTATFDASSGGGTITRNVAWTAGSITISAFTGTFGNSGDTSAVNVNNFTSTGAGTRTTNLGASTWTCGVSGVTACAWTRSGSTNETFNANTSTVAFSGSVAGTAQFVFLGPTSSAYNNVTFLPDGGGANTLGTNANGNNNTTIANLTIGAPNWIFINNINWTITGTLAFSGGTPSFSAYTSIVSASFGNNFAFILSGGAATCNYCVFRDVTATTNAITANNSINGGHLTNITVNPASAGGGGGGRIIGG